MNQQDSQTRRAKGSRINKQWHDANRMPKNPSVEQRIQWHVQHAQSCVCRPIPPKLQEIIDKRKAQQGAEEWQSSSFESLRMSGFRFRSW